jgi:hypothetical protein
MDKSKDLFSKFVKKYSQMKIKAEKEGNNALRTIIKLILNSLYGRFGLKYEPYRIDFVDSSKADEISINHEVFDRLTIDENIEFIKYTTAPSDLLKELNREEYNKLKSKTDLDGQLAVRNLPIAAMIPSYGSILMNPFLNDPENPCYYTDTDSLFLKYPLEDKYIGTELGKFSFKGKALRAYFISPKTYCLIMEDGTVIIKCKGLNNKLLNEEHFKALLSGENVYIDTSKIFTNLKTGSGGIKPMTLTIKPEINNRRLRSCTIKGEGLDFDSEPYHVIDGIVNISDQPNIDNLTRSITVYTALAKNIIKYNYTSNKTIPIIYIGVLTRTITVYIPKNIIKLDIQSNKNPLNPLPPIIADPSMIPNFKESAQPYTSEEKSNLTINKVDYTGYGPYSNYENFDFSKTVQ